VNLLQNLLALARQGAYLGLALYPGAADRSVEAVALEHQARVVEPGF
jgi:hypothetical protein